MIRGESQNHRRSCWACCPGWAATDCPPWPGDSDWAKRRDSQPSQSSATSWNESIKRLKETKKIHEWWWNVLPSPLIFGAAWAWALSSARLDSGGFDEWRLRYLQFVLVFFLFLSEQVEFVLATFVLSFFVNVLQCSAMTKFDYSMHGGAIKALLLIWYDFDKVLSPLCKDGEEFCPNNRTSVLLITLYSGCPNTISQLCYWYSSFEYQPGMISIWYQDDTYFHYLFISVECWRSCVK